MLGARIPTNNCCPLDTITSSCKQYNIANLWHIHLICMYSNGDIHRGSKAKLKIGPSFWVVLYDPQALLKISGGGEILNWGSLSP